MTEHVVPSASGHRWYSHHVLLVADLTRALRFHIEQLGFEKSRHSGDGAGTVCQVSGSDCEIILCQDPARWDTARLFIELTADGLRDLRREAAVSRAGLKARVRSYSPAGEALP